MYLLPFSPKYSINFVKQNNKQIFQFCQTSVHHTSLNAQMRQVILGPFLLHPGEAGSTSAQLASWDFSLMLSDVGVPHSCPTFVLYTLAGLSRRDFIKRMLGGSQNFLVSFGSYIPKNLTLNPATELCSENSGCQRLAAEPLSLVTGCRWPLVFVTADGFEPSLKWMLLIGRTKVMCPCLGCKGGWENTSFLHSTNFY